MCFHTNSAAQNNRKAALRGAPDGRTDTDSASNWGQKIGKQLNAGASVTARHMRECPMAKEKRSVKEFFASTVRVHAVHDPEQNARIMQACVQQRAVHNRTIEYLLNHRNDEPLQKSKARGVIGLYGRWPEWRSENEGLAEVPSLTARAQSQVQPTRSPNGRPRTWNTPS